MSLHRVSVQASPGEPPTVAVDGSPIPGVRSAQITVGPDLIPQVSLLLSASQVNIELPAGVSVLRAGPSAADFAERINPARLEGLAVQQFDLDPDATQGEAFAAAVGTMAAEFDADNRG